MVLGLVCMLVLTGLAAGHKYHSGACPSYEAMKDFDINKVSEQANYSSKTWIKCVYNHII